MWVNNQKKNERCRGSKASAIIVWAWLFFTPFHSSPPSPWLQGSDMLLTKSVFYSHLFKKKKKKNVREKIDYPPGLHTLSLPIPSFRSWFNDSAREKKSFHDAFRSIKRMDRDPFCFFWSAEQKSSSELHSKRYYYVPSLSRTEGMLHAFCTTFLYLWTQEGGYWSVPQ